MYITCEADLRKAQIALNSLIETVNSYGGKVFLTMNGISNKEYEGHKFLADSSTS